MFNNLSLPLLVLVFVGVAVVVWVAGVQLSNNVDVLASRLGLGEALGALLLLSIATNLPEIAIVSSAALHGDLGIAIGNILGGVAIQLRSWSTWTSPASGAESRSPTRPPPWPWCWRAAW